MTITQTCRHCGATFKASAVNSTVHCPAHRTADSRKSSTTSKVADRPYRVHYERRDGIQDSTIILATSHKHAMRVARERVPMGSIIRGIVEA